MPSPAIDDYLKTIYHHTEWQTERITPSQLAAELGLAPSGPQHIRDFDPVLLESREIATGRHCYGCTAGAGSGCQGAIV